MQSYGEIGDLHNQGLASYGWGTFRISLSRLSAYAERRYLVEALAGLEQNLGIWETAAQFRAFISLAHEIAHYQQDMCTGVGHWDYLSRKTFRSEVLGCYRLFTWTSDQADVASGRSQLELLAHSSIFNAYAKRSDQAQEWIRSALQGLDNYTDDDNRFWTVPRLLELDAVLSVWSSVRGLAVTTDGKAVMEELTTIFNPFKMSSEYSETFVACLQAFLSMNGITLETSSEGKLKVLLDVFVVVLPIFLDISLAHPPPDYFLSDEKLRCHFEPGIRLVRIVRQAQRIAEFSRNPDDDLLVAIDEATRHTLEFEYPAISQIYSDWVDYIDRRGDDDPILTWRREMCERRVAAPSAFANRKLVVLLITICPYSLICREKKITCT